MLLEMLFAKCNSLSSIKAALKSEDPTYGLLKSEETRTSSRRLLWFTKSIKEAANKVANAAKEAGTKAENAAKATERAAKATERAGKEAGGKAKEAAEKTAAATERAGKEAAEAAAVAERAAKEVGGKAKEAGEKTATAEKVTKEAAEAAAVAESAAKEAAEEAKEAGGKLAQKISEAAKEAGEKTAAVVKEAAEKTTAAAKEAAEKTAEAAKEAAEKTVAAAKKVALVALETLLDVHANVEVGINYLKLGENMIQTFYNNIDLLTCACPILKYSGYKPDGDGSPPRTHTPRNTAPRTHSAPPEYIDTICTWEGRALASRQRALESLARQGQPSEHVQKTLIVLLPWSQSFIYV